MKDESQQTIHDLAERLNRDVLEPMKRAFVAKDEIIDLLGVSLVAGENLFILGPPGTAKSALVHHMASRLEGRVFSYLLTRFTEPNEIFGPFDIRKLREGELVTNTEGMLPEASFVFLDELLNANSAILNSLLMVLNERIFRRGRETRHVPTLMFVGASNHLPEDEALGALFDRFLLRVRCENVPTEQLQEVADAGWKLDLDGNQPKATFPMDDIMRMQRLLGEVHLAEVRPIYIELVHRLRHAGIDISDRRVVKLQRLIAASALVCGRFLSLPSDLWILRYIWDNEDQPEVLASIVEDAINKTRSENEQAAHPRSRNINLPDPENLARDLARIEDRLAEPDLSETERTYLHDRLGLLAGRCQWVPDNQQRAHLEKQIESLWPKAKPS
ncbi:MAG: AAA family ATPase [Pirellulales bacterium]|nr:AAA family ATPase [Pirellulales bacterium]